MSAESRVAIITGGGTGVGRATGLLLAKQGWNVVVNYSRSRAEAEATIEAMGQTGSRAITVHADVADDAACRAMVDRTIHEFGRVDLLVNNAGTTEFIPFDDLERVIDDVWLRLYQVNVMGAFHCARAVHEPMLALGGGQIINISSVAAHLHQGSSIPYCCSKAALESLTVSLARTLAPQIRVNCVAPGFIADRWTQQGLGQRFEQVKSAYEQTLPLGIVCAPEDIAEGILSLVNGSRLVTGQVLTVDGGMLISGFQVKLT